MKNIKYKGLTPTQIKKAVNKPMESKEQPLFVPKKIYKKPETLVRKMQTCNNSLLLNLPFNTTRTAFQYDVPNWFTSTQKCEVSIIVPLFKNSAQKLIESWDLLCDGIKTEIIFVDDNCPLNSKDSVISQWEKRKNELQSPIGRIYYSTEHQGWGACCNIGAEVANSEILVFMNPDTIITRGWLRPLVRLIRKSDIGAVGSLQIDINDRTFIDAGSEWSWEQKKFLEIGRQTYDGKLITKPFQINNTPIDLTESGEREKISSNCMAVTKSNFRYYGGFSPNLNSQEWSDSDFCMFLKEKNLKIICQCNSQVFRESNEIKKTCETGSTYFNNKWIVSSRIDSLIKAKRINDNDLVESIVIRRRAAHGDVFLAASVAPALKKKYPKAQIIFSTDCPEVLKDNLWIDKVIEIHSERWFKLYYDLDMVYEYRPDVNILQAYADAVGVNVKDCETFIKIESPELEIPEKYAVMHAGKTLWAGRNWTTLKFDSISSKLKNAGYHIICVGTWSDHKTTSCDLDLREKTNIQQLADVISKASLFIGIDSFPMHLAQHFEVPGVCFFGSIKPESRLFNNSIKPIVATGLKCLGCHHRKSTPCTSTSECEVGIQDCVNGVSSEQMWRTIQSLF